MNSKKVNDFPNSRQSIPIRIWFCRISILYVSIVSKSTFNFRILAGVRHLSLIIQHFINEVIHTLIYHKKKFWLLYVPNKLVKLVQIDLAALETAWKTPLAVFFTKFHAVAQFLDSTLKSTFGKLEFSQLLFDYILDFLFFVWIQNWIRIWDTSFSKFI